MWCQYPGEKPTHVRFMYLQSSSKQRKNVGEGGSTTVSGRGAETVLVGGTGFSMDRGPSRSVGGTAIHTLGFEEVPTCDVTPPPTSRSATRRRGVS